MENSILLKNYDTLRVAREFLSEILHHFFLLQIILKTIIEREKLKEAKMTNMTRSYISLHGRNRQTSSYWTSSL